MAVTYSQIATYTASGSTGGITFSSIPSTYTDLILVVDAIGVSGGIDGTFQFNGDTGSNYSRSYIYSDGSSVTSARITNATQIGNGTKMIHNFMNYANTSMYKTSIGRYGYGAGGGGSIIQTILWRSTAAINSIAVNLSQNYTSTSTFTLYGITAA